MEKVSRNDREWSLRDEAHTNNDRWRSSDDNNRDDGQNSVVSKQAVREQLRERRQRDRSRSHCCNNNNDGSYHDYRDRQRQSPTNAMYAMDATDAEVVTISRMANTTQAAENAADTAMAMIARQYAQKCVMPLQVRKRL